MFSSPSQCCGLLQSLHLLKPLLPVGVEGTSLVSIIIVLILLLPTSAVHHTYTLKTWWWLIMFVELQKLCSELHCYNQTGIGNGIGLFAL
jgi:hypothetical protein